MTKLINQPSYEAARDEAAENAWLSPDISPDEPVGFTTFQELFCKGYDQGFQTHAELVAGLVEALEFYANKANWTRVGRTEEYFLKTLDSDDLVKYTADDVLHIAGARARKTLETYKKQTEGRTE